MSVSNDRDRLDVEAQRFLATIRVLEAAHPGTIEALCAFYDAIDAADQDDPRALRKAMRGWWDTVPMADRNSVLAALRQIFSAR